MVCFLHVLHSVEDALNSLFTSRLRVPITILPPKKNYGNLSKYYKIYYYKYTIVFSYIYSRRN